MSDIEKKYDVIIVGAGVAGLNAAQFLPRDKNILLISKESPRHSDSYLAQGGMCVLKWDGDYDSYFEDTMRAGHYENNPQTVGCMIRSSRETEADLMNTGVRFARDASGNLLYTREGGHSQKRILYHEDCTGKEITSHLRSRVAKLKNVHIRPYTALIDLLVAPFSQNVGDGAENATIHEKDKDAKQVCTGAVLRDEKTGEVFAVNADYVVLATGGVGGLFRFSTNYRGLTGDGVAICLRRGVAVENVDYIQIHPTTLYTKKRGRRFLISESVRGEGAVLLNGKGERFTDELRPRDVVTAAIRAEMEKEGSDHVFLDLRRIPAPVLQEHFPSIVKRCAQEGYDVFSAPIPVVPGQHYFMGGVKSDIDGRTSMPRLFAVGETCCNGVHGKNRLASNSLLEALIFAKRAALYISNTYENAPQSLSELGQKGFDRGAYADKRALAAEYKNSVLSEIEKEKNLHMQQAQDKAQNIDENIDQNINQKANKEKKQ